MFVLKDLTAALLAKLSPSPNEVVEELKSRLALKERLFQEILSDRSRQTQEHHTLIQDLLNTISSRDQYIKVKPNYLYSLTRSSLPIISSFVLSIF